MLIHIADRESEYLLSIGYFIDTSESLSFSLISQYRLIQSDERLQP